jgi:hypothetical protein
MKIKGQKMKYLNKSIILLIIILISGLMVATVIASVTYDPATGSGFVGKGDIQLLFGWNNKQLQDNAGSVQFRTSTISEVSWECTNTNNDKIQERERTTTSSQVVSVVARERNQITGFILTGFGDILGSTTDGPPVNSCPSGPWILTSPAGDPVVVGGGGLQVSINGTNWFDL